jgi:hypothetical protein
VLPDTREYHDTVAADRGTRPPILHVALIRRLSRRVATIALAFVAIVGCGDDPPSTANLGVAGTGGTGGGIAGAGGDCGACDAGSGTAGTGGASDAGGTGGGIAGVGGAAGTSAGGSIGGAGKGGSIGGAGKGGSIGGAGAGGGIGGAGAGGAGAGGAGAGGTIGGAGPGKGGQAGQVTLQPWPTSDTVVTVDAMNEFSKNVSDLVYEQRSGGAGDVLWAVQNDPSVIYALVWNGTTWNSTTDNGWGSGKTIRYPGGTGHPDSEGLTRAEWSSTAIYVAAERDNDNNAVSRLSVLRYDTAAAGTELVATNEWNLTPDLPTSGANLGLEAVAWVPDTFLVANGFFDESTNALYDPSRYANHGTGLFLVGLESNGMIYGYALDHSGGTFQKVATIASDHPSIMSLYFDRDVGNLWAYCDNTCANQASVLRIADGHFAVQYLYDHPASLPSSNFEGITFAPESECALGKKSFFWTDDDNAGGHALYRGTIPCGLLP